MTTDTRIRRTEIIIEAPLLDKVIAEVCDCGAKGYTVLRGHSGKGERGTWQEGQISPAQHMMILIVIADSHGDGRDPRTPVQQSRALFGRCHRQRCGRTPSTSFLG